MEAEVWNEWKLVSRRHDKLFINSVKAPVYDGDENLQWGHAYREYVLQGKELFAECKICEETDSECHCGYRERDEGQELVRAAESIMSRVRNVRKPRKRCRKEQKASHMNDD